MNDARTRSNLPLNLLSAPYQTIREHLSAHICSQTARRLGKEFPPFPVRIAKNNEDRARAFTLVYEEYVKRGICPEHSSRQHFSHYAILPSAVTMLLEGDSVLSGTATVITDSAFGLPLESLYAEELNTLRNDGVVPAEVTLLALDHRVLSDGSYSLTSKQKMYLVFSLFSAVVAHCLRNQEVTDLTIVVHPRHYALYKLIGFRPFGEIRAYAGACDKPALPLRGPIGEVLSRFIDLGFDRYVYDVLQWEVGEPESGIPLLFGKRNLWPTLSVGTQAAIATLMGEALSQPQ